MTTKTALANKAPITKNYLQPVISCMQDKGYDISDFEISTEHVRGYTGGYPAAKTIIYVFRISTGIEKTYALDGNPSFSDALCFDLEKKTFGPLEIL